MDESSSSNQTNLNSHPQKGPSKRLLATLIVILSIAVLVLVFLLWQQSQSTDSQLKTSGSFTSSADQSEKPSTENSDKVALTQQACDAEGICFDLPANWRHKLATKADCGQAQPCKVLRVYDDQNQEVLISQPIQGVGGVCSEATTEEGALTVLASSKTNITTSYATPVYAVKAILEDKTRSETQYLFGLSARPQYHQIKTAEPVYWCGAALLAGIITSPITKYVTYVYQGQSSSLLMEVSSVQAAKDILTTDRADLAFEVLKTAHYR